MGTCFNDNWRTVNDIAAAWVYIAINTILCSARSGKCFSRGAMYKCKRQDSVELNKVLSFCSSLVQLYIYIYIYIYIFPLVFIYKTS